MRAFWKAKPKIVFSRTLETVEWNSRLVRDNVSDEVAKLKAEPGGNLEVGGASIASTLLRLGLIDEFRVLVHPVVLGGGTPFFPASDTAISLSLIDTRTFRSGVVYLRYQRIGEP